MALTPDEESVLASLQRKLGAQYVDDELNLSYYLGQQRLQQLGMAIPPNMRRFLVIVNWPRVVVDTIERRQNVRSLVLPGRETDDKRLRAIWDGNNMDADLTMFNLDTLIYGRGFLSVGANEDDRRIPLMHVESPREMVADVDQRKRSLKSAARFYGVDDAGFGPLYATLYLPDVTVWLEKDTGTGQWVEADRDEHNLGRVPIVMHLNRRMSGTWQGQSELNDIKGVTDAAARAITNLQFAQEAHGVPQRFALGVSQGDFVDKDGNPLPAWEAYFNAIWANKNPNIKVGQFDAADLNNFETAVNLYGKQAAVLTGFPARYFGLFTTNPPAEGAIRADESQLVESVERRNAAVGTTLGWAVALAYKFAYGREVTGNRIRVDWHDPATPTVAQRMDAVVKAKSVEILSREGAWDELGWSEARKAKERAYFAAQPAPNPPEGVRPDGLLRDGAVNAGSNNGAAGN